MTVAITSKRQLQKLIGNTINDMLPRLKIKVINHKKCTVGLCKPWMRMETNL